ncbi:hypothetical protein K450DRAFT_228129 [Umbelopsis ramanniana AG]|uniref:Acetyl-CoA synthetase-like protein n=1 Tax=Umbelopsis ramanniana AG TaxID=1314678 RepID=A0AAD5EF20_UMBRA|nr:uncharacterized protein K450DRAFT_228129 [Umbelopsis ramanniana AG]KAI8582264.1 hypothetical protein K450DRAFT_228129 [Umbelopsis ramanniana AG]
MIFQSPRSPIDIPNLDLYTFLFTENEFNRHTSPSKKVLVDAATGESITYGQLRDQSSRLGHGWTARAGLQQGDVVAVFAPNQHDHPILYYSLLAAKCVISPGNPAYTEQEMLHQISDSGAKAVVTVPALLPLVIAAATKCNIPIGNIYLFGESEVQGCKPFRSLMGEEHVQFPISGINPSEDLSFICYSSGTTGRAKGVMLTHRNFVSNVLQVTHLDKDFHRLDDVYMGFLPFYHIYGINSLVLSVCGYRAQLLVVIPKYTLENFLKAVEKYKITYANIVPPVAVHLGKDPLVKKYDTSSLRMLGCGAAPLGKEHIEAIDRQMGVGVKQGYGMTECSSTTTSQPVDELDRIGSVGVLIANNEMKIVDEQGNGNYKLNLIMCSKKKLLTMANKFSITALGIEGEGEILIRGPNIMKGYLNNPKANAETFTADGWLRTGDIGKMAKDGHCYVVDRLKELIKVKGFQVAPAELEALLMGRNDIADVCVIGVYNDAQATEFPRAYIVLQGNTSPSKELATTIEKYVAENVAPHKRLRGGIRFVNSIPKSPSGKILRRVIKTTWIKEEEEQERVKNGLRARL